MAVVDIKGKKAQEVCKELQRKGIRSTAIQADVTCSAECSRYMHLRLDNSWLAFTYSVSQITNFLY